ncbi:uncharacterized protein B0H18DRAFT_469202 [Fomitopsis serialis]|uniref:uncharacterized protein n=1 Tax=Fomitopsis serialis TaxID=139415 RepID=UPI0020075B20|nr:uncharacterized protein B0H18DRAFT_469202 [Neoantrodia serialis]KAH9910421.1 hypothetical protein B0H18DRAFT_469202 [Neoantrodia serialis]
MDFKQRTGTFYFMAVEVLRGRGIVHQARHDLESFFWLLVWLVFRHTRHDHPDPHSLMKVLFDGPSDIACAGQKRGFFGSDFAVHDNEPLSNLLNEFSNLCEGNSHRSASTPAPSPLTYAAVLDIFDRALARTDWPENDAAIPFKPAGDNDTAPLHEARDGSTWMSTGSQMTSGGQHHPVPSNIAPGSGVNAPVVGRPLARGQRGARGSGLLSRPPAWPTFGNAQGADHSPEHHVMQVPGQPSSDGQAHWDLRVWLICLLPSRLRRRHEGAPQLIQARCLVCPCFARHPTRPAVRRPVVPKANIKSRRQGGREPRRAGLAVAGNGPKRT